MLRRLLLCVVCLQLLQRVCAEGFELLERLCANETGVGTFAHKHVLDRLNGRRIIFVGDSVTRYQVLFHCMGCLWTACFWELVSIAHMVFAATATNHNYAPTDSTAVSGAGVLRGVRPLPRSAVG